jgi:hypothetical protein
VAFGCRISKIEEDHVTFEVPPVENFMEVNRNRLWVSMIAEKINS